MKKKILLVEDDLFLAKVLKAKLVQIGHDVMDIADGAAAVPAAKSFKPNVILLDVGLPHKNGFDILREMKKDLVLQHVPVFILTKLAGENDKSLALKLGAKKYFKKLELRIDRLMDELSRA